jgi:magnesium transporter
MLFIVLLMLVNQSAEKALTMTSRFIQQSRIQVEKIRNNKLLEFIDIENSLYDISALLVRMETIVSGIITKPFFRPTEDQEELLKDIYLAIQQMSDIVKANIRTVVNTRDAISTIMTANLNRVIKLFTSLTVLLTVPMLVATFYGMNIELPLAESKDAFYILIGGTVIMSTTLFLIFVKKDWL